ncbi:MAG: hypothetical protein QW771_03625, partial [Candidatus Micrarchaeia archaeon]
YSSKILSTFQFVHSAAQKSSPLFTKNNYRFVQSHTSEDSKDKFRDDSGERLENSLEADEEEESR